MTVLACPVAAIGGSEMSSEPWIRPASIWYVRHTEPPKRPLLFDVVPLRQLLTL